LWVKFEAFGSIIQGSRFRVEGLEVQGLRLEV
jgi:hypothetical protein